MLRRRFVPNCRTCASEATPVLLVDFAGVDYIDSSGLATFIEYLRDASAL